MHIDIIRKENELKIDNISCGCSFDHDIPDMKIYISTGLLGSIADVISGNMDGRSVLIVADKNTYRVAAEKVIENLSENGYNCKLCLLEGEKVEPSPERTQEIISAIEPNTDFLLSVGSGVITDLTRRASFLQEKPFAVFGTAASMDGYTSITSSLMENGMKITKYGHSAKLLMFDPAVLATAPAPMQAAGIGDVLAKYNVLVDWKLGAAVAGETFCPVCEKLLLEALDLCSSNVDEIIKRTAKGMQALIESLILAGLTVLIVRSTRPVASVEHNISHYFEMAALAYGGSSPSHGIGVGIGLIYSLLFHDILRNLDIDSIDEDKIKAQKMSKEQKKDFLLSYYPPGIGEEVMLANETWHLTWPQQLSRIKALKDYHEQYKKDCDILPSYKDIIDIFEKLASPTSAKKAGIDRDRLEKALLCTKDYRTRYSISQALDELGMLPECVDKILSMEDSL